MRYLFLVLIGLLLPSLAHANIDLVSSSQTPEVGDAFVIDVRYTGTDFINAVEGELDIPTSLVVESIFTNDSPIALWVEHPADSKTQTLRFSGTAPGGFTGGQSLFQVIVSAQDAGSQSFSLLDASGYLHDGLGSRVRFEDTYLTLTVESFDPATPPTTVQVEDNEPPTIVAEIVVDESEPETITYLIHYGRDKETAVRSIELHRHGTTTYLTTTPTELKTGWFAQRATLIATDAAGNQSRRSVIIPGRLKLFGYSPLMTQALAVGIPTLLATLVCLHLLHQQLVGAVFGRRRFG